MRIGVMAAGGVGGYFGARLGAAGHDVVFFARGSHLAALREHGLKVESVLGDVHLNDIQAVDDPAQVAPVDIVLFAVKLWDTEAAAQSLRPLVGPDTRVITVQNGIDARERLEPILGRGRVVPGLAQIATVIGSPGVIVHTSKFALIRCGHPDGHADPPLTASVEAARKAGIDIAVSEAIELELWQKFVFLSSLAGITAATRLPIGPLLTDPDTRALFHNLLREVVAVGRAKGVELPADGADKALAFADATLPPDMKASMAHDLERGNRIELDWLTGKVVALGRALGVPTPASEIVYAVLKPHRMGRS
ncbi:MAG: ketopantoate reductase family protein [Xanthobacteraceae bacterium]